MGMLLDEWVRPARPDDGPSVQKLLSVEGLEAEFVAREFVVCESDGRIVGCARAWRVPEGGTELASVVVDPAHRGRGLARSLAEAALLGAPHPVYALTLVPEMVQRGGFESIPEDALPPSLRAKATSCTAKGRPWRPMRLRQRSERIPSAE